MTYQEAVDYIASLEPRGWRLGLDRMQEFIKRLGLVHAIDGTEIDYYHVAGTNGKGSTTASIQSLLHYQGVKVGAFFSPFVYNPRERIQIGLELISESDFAQLTEEVIPTVEGMSGTEFGGITEFEFKTAMGFMAWNKAECHAVALETGLGGRLDATNVVESPVCSVIVSIGLDHQSVLGNTIEEIAFEKAGIIKGGKPVVVGEMPEGARNVILEVAKSKNAPVHLYRRDFFTDAKTGTFQSSLGTYHNAIPTQMKGKWQVHNLALAIEAVLASALPLTQGAVSQCINNTSLPGRYQKVEIQGVTFIFDGAHNPDSASALAITFQRDTDFTSKKAIVISNMVAGHEPKEFYKPLSDLTESLIIPPINFHRARATQEIAEIAEGLGFKVEVADSTLDAINQAIELAKKQNLPILVTGSFYLVGEVGHALALI